MRSLESHIKVCSDNLTNGRGEWKHRSGTDIPTSFNQAIMFPMEKLCMQFLWTRITLALNISNVNTFRAILICYFTEKNKYASGGGSILV